MSKHFPAYSREQQLWFSATEGNLELVKTLAGDMSVDVNWRDPDWGRTSFYRACFYGHPEIVKYMLGNPRIDVTVTQNQGATALNAAAQQDQWEVVDLLLGDPRVDVNQPTEGATPFFLACENGNMRTITLLLADPRIDVNLPKKNNCSPLWMVTQEGHLAVAQRILASERSVQTQIRAQLNDKTASQMGHSMATISKASFDSDETHRRKQQFGPIIGDLIDQYEADPVAVRNTLRRLPHIRGISVRPSLEVHL